MNHKNFKKQLLGGFTAATFTAMNATSSMAAGSDILFVLDGSGSMWGQIGGVAKIETAKKSMVKMLGDIPADSRIGLMTYGANDKNSCADVTQLNAIGAERSAIRASIQNLTPLGKTPIDLALSKGIATIGAQSGDSPRSLVLVSDGIETCNGDPCKVAGSAKLRGIDMKIHVVGFNVSNDARAQLECIAKAGDGQYFDAANTQGFEKAIDQVVQVAQAEIKPAPEPVTEEPKGPTITEFFRDDFDGEELAEHWAIENPNPDNFIVEDGVLTMLSTSVGGFSVAKPSNLITYTGKLPKGDWDAVITYTGDYTAYTDRLTFGLRKDEGNFIAPQYTYYSTPCTKTFLQLQKASKGKVDKSSVTYRAMGSSIDCGKPLINEGGSWEGGSWNKSATDHKEKPIALTIQKRGRAYTASVEMLGYKDKDGKSVVGTTEKFTSLRSPGQLSFTVDRPFKGEGEVLMSINSVVINKVEK